MLVHAVTNLALSLYVIWMGRWEFWMWKSVAVIRGTVFSIGIQYVLTEYLYWILCP